MMTNFLLGLICLVGVDGEQSGIVLRYLFLTNEGVRA